MNGNLGKTLLIANPTSQNGKGEQAANQAAHFLFKMMGKDQLEVRRTEYPRHATEIAGKAGKFDTVIALGGDGLVHETVAGLMCIRKKARPALGVIPVGSGNDYARSLDLKTSLAESCELLLSATPRQVDLGCVNGEYYTETLSFGLDAAIALDTVQRRVRTGHTGTRLYMESGFDQLFHHMHLIPCTLSADDGPSRSVEFLSCAVQNGPFYGGGFKICPDAKLDDGILDICIAHGPFSKRTAVKLFVQAKSGKHVGKKRIEHFCCRKLKLHFDEVPPAQFDGEKIEAQDFEVCIEPEALRVLR